MTKTRANTNLIQAADTAIKECDTIRNQNIQLYKIDKENNFNNTNEKYINSDSYNNLIF
jgi:hypothetical protein